MATEEQVDLEDMQDAEAELAASASARPTRERAAPQPISGDAGEGSGSSLAGVTRPAPGALATPGPDRSRELNPEDIRIPQIKLSQAMSGVAQSEEDAIRPGNWYFTLDNTNFGPKVKVVAFEVFKSRAYMIPGAGLSCRSSDMVNGIGDPGGLCDPCELKNWPEQGVKGGPKCRIGYNFPCAVIPDEWEPGMPLQIGMVRLSGTSAPAGQQMIGMWSQSGKEWHELSFILGNIRKPYGQNSSYQVATAGWGGPPDPKFNLVLSEFAERVRQAQANKKTISVVGDDEQGSD